jgi:hypothetical protein
MKSHRTFGKVTAALGLAAGAFLSATACAQSNPAGNEADKWMFTASIYGFLPHIGGRLSVPVDAGGDSIDVDAKTIIDHLKFTVMGTFDAHYGNWGAFTDVIYLNVGGNKSNVRTGTIGVPVETTADLNLDLKGTIWTVAGEYRVISDPAMKMDILAGARLFDVKTTLGWSFHGDIGPIPEPGRNGSREISGNVWDGIVGVKGNYAFGDDRKWFAPFYLDVGTGDSQLTWQIAGGIGYRFGWGEVFGMWRYLDYNFKSGKELEDVNFNGPMVGVAFQW